MLALGPNKPPLQLKSGTIYSVVTWHQREANQAFPSMSTLWKLRA